MMKTTLVGHIILKSSEKKLSKIRRGYVQKYRRETIKTPYKIGSNFLETLNGKCPKLEKVLPYSFPELVIFGKMKKPSFNWRFLGW